MDVFPTSVWFHTVFVVSFRGRDYVIELSHVYNFDTVFIRFVYKILSFLSKTERHVDVQNFRIWSGFPTLKEVGAKKGQRTSTQKGNGILSVRIYRQADTGGREEWMTSDSLYLSSRTSGGVWGPPLYMDRFSTRSAPPLNPCLFRTLTVSRPDRT